MICNSAMKKRIAELERHNWDLREGKARVEQMMRQALDNNYELRNDNYQLRPRVEELERQLQGIQGGKCQTPANPDEALPFPLGGRGQPYPRRTGR